VLGEPHVSHEKNTRDSAGFERDHLVNVTEYYEHVMPGFVICVPFIYIYDTIYIYIYIYIYIVSYIYIYVPFIGIEACKIGGDLPLQAWEEEERGECASGSEPI
jgi:hypothetical protein